MIPIWGESTILRNCKKREMCGWLVIDDLFTKENATYIQVPNDLSSLLKGDWPLLFTQLLTFTIYTVTNLYNLQSNLTPTIHECDFLSSTIHDFFLMAFLADNLHDYLHDSKSKTIQID